MNSTIDLRNTVALRRELLEGISVFRPAHANITMRLTHHTSCHVSAVPGHAYAAALPPAPPLLASLPSPQLCHL